MIFSKTAVAILPMLWVCALMTYPLMVVAEDVAEGNWLCDMNPSVPPCSDGLPPAGEHVCDQYDDNGQAFGLCNAYCEAQDCESPTANKKICDPLREKFLQITGETRFPCEPFRCPCWDDINSVLLDRPLIADFSLVNEPDAHFFYSAWVRFDASRRYFAKAEFKDGRNICTKVGPTIKQYWVESEDQFDACIDDILMYAAQKSGVDDSVKSSCEPYADSAVSCPCWDGSARPFPDNPDVTPVFPDIDGTELLRSGFAVNSTIIQVTTPRQFIGTSFEAVKRPDTFECTGEFYNEVNISQAQFEKCRNDILALSAALGVNECHNYF